MQSGNTGHISKLKDKFSTKMYTKEQLQNFVQKRQSKQFADDAGFAAFRSMQSGNTSQLILLVVLPFLSAL